MLRRVCTPRSFCSISARLPAPGAVVSCLPIWRSSTVSTYRFCATDIPPVTPPKMNRSTKTSASLPASASPKASEALHSAAPSPPDGESAALAAEKEKERLEAEAKVLLEASEAYREVQSEIESQLNRLRAATLEKHDATFHFLTPIQHSIPMVMMLGNHSSGKSTLINFLAGREIQQTGVAPTDDGFTLIRRGTYDLDVDGPSVVSNPQMQFEGLQKFGLTFVRHLRQKSRVMPSTSRLPMDVFLVDTPGMIDTPVHVKDRTSEAGQLRGYDFLGATRWFAQQSDVILLMFDPANPGTTGETLDVLTKSLVGQEHKFLIIMNKVDMFGKVTDFARTYGTLCWNLSKVIPLKDVPRIYTTCTPLSGKGDQATNVAEGEEEMLPPSTVPDEEVERQRAEIISEIFSAPMRRMDNMITETEDSARSLLLACQVSKSLRAAYRQRAMTVYGSLGLFCLTAPAAVVLLSSISISGTIAMTLLSIAAGFGGYLLSGLHLTAYESQLCDTIDLHMRRFYPHKKFSSDLESRWQTVVRPEILRCVMENRANGNGGVSSLPSCSSSALRGMESLVSEELPRLRLRVSDIKHAEKMKNSKRKIF